MHAFISYSWDSDAHKDWVREFADALIRNGINVTLDQYDLKIGADRFAFMEQSVASADVVLCVCSPSYVDRANGREKGVGVETTLITPEFFGQHKGKQYIPVVRHSDGDKPATPDYMAALIFVDFRDDAKFDANFEDLLRHLYDKPKHEKPQLGEVPEFDSPKNATTTTTTPAPVPSNPDVRIRVSPGIASVPNGETLQLLSITAENHSDVAVFLKGFRITLNDPANQLALFFDSVTGRPVVPKRLDPGESVSLNVSRESFGEGTPPPEEMTNSKVIDAIGREYTGDPDEFSAAIKELFRPK